MIGEVLVAYRAFAITQGAIAAERGREASEMLSYYCMELRFAMAMQVVHRRPSARR
jgi:hypothetical protein